MNDRIPTAQIPTAQTAQIPTALPANDSSPHHAQRSQLYQTVMSSFRGQIQPVETKHSYRVGIVISAIAMFMLPTIYVLTMLLIVILSLVSIFVFPCIGFFVAAIGFLTFIIMFKPILTFFAGIQEHAMRQLEREKERLLFDFVDRICDCVGSPKPAKIKVMNDVNAAASLGQGWWHGQADCELIIGLPLVAGLNMRQLGGVLAHEFGHFSQTSGSRLGRFIHYINHWMVHSITHRDSFDYFLMRVMNDVPYLGFIVYLAQFSFWLVRRFIWCLLMLGNLISGVMSRQLEFDADHYENRLAGTESFIQTQRLLNTLSLAQEYARQDIGSFYRDGQLGDDYSRLVLSNFEHIEPKVLAKLEKRAKEYETGIFDSHPCDRERILNVANDPQPGIFQLEMPAALLFSNFEATSHITTVDFYKEVLGKEFDPTRLKKTADLFRKQKDDIEGYKALFRFLQGLYFDVMSLELPHWQLSTQIDSHDIKKRMAERRQAIMDLSPGYKNRIKRLNAVYQLRFEAEQAMAVAAAGFEFRGDAFSIGVTNGQQALHANRQLLAEFNHILAGMQAHRRLSGQRIIDALELTQFEKVAKPLNIDQHKIQEIKTLLRVCEALRNANHDRERLDFETSALVAVTQIAHSTDGGSYKTRDTFNRLMGMVNQKILKLQNDLNAIAYPFEHADGNISISRYLLQTLPFPDSPISLTEASQEMTDNFDALAYRAFGRIVTIVEQVEKLFGFEPFPEPDFENEDST